MKVSELVQKYVELRDEKAQIQAEAAKKIQPIQAKMDMIEAALLGVFEKSGIDSTKTEFGTAYVSTRTSVSLADKESFREFCKQTGEWGMADIRASKVNV